MSGEREKYRHFPYIKQNSIAEIVSTMESFLVAGVGLERPGRVACRFLRQAELAQKASRFGSTVSAKSHTVAFCAY